MPPRASTVQRRLHDHKLEYFHQTGTAVAELYWSAEQPLEEEGKAFDPRGQTLLDKTKERAAKLAAEKQQALAEASAKL